MATDFTGKTSVGVLVGEVEAKKTSVGVVVGEVEAKKTVKAKKPMEGSLPTPPLGVEISLLLIVPHRLQMISFFPCY